MKFFPDRAMTRTPQVAAEQLSWARTSRLRDEIWPAIQGGLARVDLSSSPTSSTSEPRATTRWPEIPPEGATTNGLHLKGGLFRGAWYCDVREA